MTYTWNGYKIDPPRHDLVVAGVRFGDVRNGSVFTVLEYVAGRYHREVEPLHSGQCGAYNDRYIKGTKTPSRHWLAIAIDINWTLHPAGRLTHSYAQEQAIRRILDSCDGVVRWGGDYSSASVDPMHFEINKPLADVTTLAKRITEGDDMALTPAQEDALVDKFINAFNNTLRNGESKLAAAMRATPWQYGAGIAKAGLPEDNTSMLRTIVDLHDRLERIEAKLEELAAPILPPPTE